MPRDDSAPPATAGGASPVTASGPQTEPDRHEPAGPAGREQADDGGQQRAATPDWFAWVIAFVTFAAYDTISVFKYLRLDPGSWDLGIFTEYVKQAAHLHAPFVAIRGLNLLGDHFQPIVMLLAPFFRLFPTPETLLVAQALLTAISVVPVCRAAQALLGTWPSRGIGLAYGFSWGLQQMIDFDFHEIAFAVPLLAFSLSALVRRRLRPAVLWALPLVFVKEDQGFTVAAIGLVMVAMGLSRARAWRAGWPGRASWAAASHGGADPAGGDPAAWIRAGLLLAVWGLAWSVLAIAVIIPHFNPAHHYPYWDNGGVIGPGGHISLAAVWHQLAHAGSQKLWTTYMILLPVAFLALRSPLALVAVPSLVLRFVSTNSYYWGTNWHYNATVMPIVFLAAIDGMARFRAASARRAAAHAPPAEAQEPGQPRRGARQRLRPGEAVARYGAVVMVIIAGWLAFRFPLAGLWNAQTYEISPHVVAEDAAMARVPDGVTVEATLTMLAPLAARDNTYWIGTSPNPAPQYIVFDNDNSGWAPVASPLTFVEQRHPGYSYQRIFLDNNVYVFRRLPLTGG
jgi:uncharacterized membrane protein